MPQWFFHAHHEIAACSQSPQQKQGNEGPQKASATLLGRGGDPEFLELLGNELIEDGKGGNLAGMRRDHLIQHFGGSGNFGFGYGLSQFLDGFPGLARRGISPSG